MSNDNAKPVLDDAGQEALARKLLGDNADGIDLYIQTTNCSDNFIGPSFIQMRINISFLVALRQRMDFCLTQKLHDSRSQRYPDQWDSNSTNVASWLYCVDQAGFSFNGFADDGTEISESYNISVNGLCHWLRGTPIEDGVQPSELNLPVQFHFYRWYGGSLFFAYGDEDEFLENVLEQHPEVAARQLAIDMQSRINDSGVLAAELNGVAPLETANRRRLGL